MKKMLITLIMILLNIIILNSKTFRLDNNPNFTLFSEKGNLNNETNIFVVAKSDKSEDSFNMSAKKTEINFAKPGLFYVNISPVLLPGVALGYGWPYYNESDKNYREIIFFLHANSMSIISTAGMGILTNTFKNPERKGLFYSISTGFDYVLEVNGILSPGGPTTTDFKKYFFPNVSLGVGYSFKMGKTSFLRIYLDVGLKYLLTNLNISYLF